MVRKIVVCIFATFIANLFLACGGGGSDDPTKPIEEGGGFVLIDIDDKWGELEATDTLKWTGNEGFFPDKEHPYGSDRYPNPRKDSINDNIVYVSVLNGKSGIINLRIVTGAGYKYYICDPTSKDIIENVDNSKSEQKYPITAKDEVKKIALCREYEGIIQKIQELHIHPYEWETYKYTLIIMGNDNSEKPENMLIQSKPFWEGFQKIYDQALVKGMATNLISIGYPTIAKITTYTDSAGNITRRDTTKVNKKYLLTKVVNLDTSVKSCKDAVSDLYKIRESYYGYRKKDMSIPPRAIMQLGLPTRRFWALKINNDNSIVVCNSKEKPSETEDYEILPIKENCIVPDATMHWNSNKWYIRINGKSELATKNNLDPECAVMVKQSVDVLDKQYLGEFNGYGEIDGKAITLTDTINNIATVILPWHGDDTKLIAHHELGHAMGLNDMYLDVNFPFNADGKTSDQSNIMFYQLQKGHILRQRSIDMYKDATLSSVKGKENQWDCLHRLPKGKPSCADASIVF